MGQERPSWTRASTSAAAVLACAILAIYAPGLGAGFIRDDFAWIRSSTLHAPLDAVRLFAEHTGFYRPLVALSFGVNRLLGLDPLAYRAVNLLLLFACAVALGRVLMRVGFSRELAIFAAGLWALNFHGINMAVLWVSGRTALLLVFFSLLAADAAIRDRWVRAAWWTLLALWSKEEAVMLPVMLLAWRYIHAGERERRLWIRRAAIVAVPLMVYAVMRVFSGAMTPLDAPPEYRFTFRPPAVARNVLEYADRAATLAVLVTIAALAVARVGRRAPPVRLAAADPAIRRRRIAMGAAWLVGGYALTVWVPVRSSLYACFPSIGAVLIAAAIVEDAFAEADARRRRIAWVGALALPFLLWPVYHARNASYAAMGAFSRSVLDDLAAQPPGTRVVIADAPDRPNMAGTFGGLLPDALALYGIPVEVCVEPGGGCGPPPPGKTVRRVRVGAGRLVSADGQ